MATSETANECRGPGPPHRGRHSPRLEVGRVVTAILDRFRDTVRALEPDLPRVVLTEGDILVLDNHRCWQGRDPHTSDRMVRILTLRTDGDR